MADPTVLTGVIGSIAGVVGAGYAIITARHEKKKEARRDADDQAANSVASWTALNAALDREIKRLHEEMDRLREEYERHLEAARRRISELEDEVAALRRLLGRQNG